MDILDQVALTPEAVALWSEKCRRLMVIASLVPGAAKALIEQGGPGEEQAEVIEGNSLRIFATVPGLGEAELILPPHMWAWKDRN